MDAGTSVISFSLFTKTIRAAPSIFIFLRQKLILIPVKIETQIMNDILSILIYSKLSIISLQAAHQIIVTNTLALARQG